MSITKFKTLSKRYNYPATIKFAPHIPKTSFMTNKEVHKANHRQIIHIMHKGKTVGLIPIDNKHKAYIDFGEVTGREMSLINKFVS